MTEAAGIIAIMVEQSNSAAMAGATDQHCTMPAKACAYPYDTKVLDVAIAAHDLDCGSGKSQIGEVGVFEAHVGLADLAVVARDDLAQVVDIDCRH